MLVCYVWCLFSAFFDGFMMFLEVPVWFLSRVSLVSWRLSYENFSKSILLENLVFGWVSILCSYLQLIRNLVQQVRLKSECAVFLEVCCDGHGFYRRIAVSHLLRQLMESERKGTKHWRHQRD